MSTGNFNKKVEIGVHDQIGRLEILQVHSKHLILDENLKLKQVQIKKFNRHSHHWQLYSVSLCVLQVCCRRYFRFV